ACRNLYDLVTDDGRVLMRNKALLSLKDLNLSARLADLIAAGVTSFKIEGRLKNASFVRNTVREYSRLLDKLIAEHNRPHPGVPSTAPDTALLRRASFGRVDGGFTPDLSKTFNRGFTELYLDGKRGKWASMDAPKSMGEEIGVVQSVRSIPQGLEITVSKVSDLHNGDGFAFVSEGEIIGFRGDLCQGNRIVCKPVAGLRAGVVLWRNISQAFEKSLEANPCKRYVGVSLKVEATESAQKAIPSSPTNPGVITLHVTATTEDGRQASVSIADCEPARDLDRASAMISGQLGKRVDHFSFSVSSLTHSGALPHLSAAALNGLRRELAAELDSQPVRAIPLTTGSAPVIAPETLQTGRLPGELMRSKYCIKYELGLCPVHQGAKQTGSLFLVNNSRRFPLLFDCASCEMAVLEPVSQK
ncbi:MAG: DUF3656 domain-containing protein, partial [Bacteroidales bacterium]|nr:DUF3656 domain-containing protein [Bacteroidales bacterium]